MFLIRKIIKVLFPFFKEKKIKEIFNILNSDKKNNAMLVGGCVRNYLNNEKIGDVDIATIFTPTEVIQKFSDTDFKIFKTGIQHGTITLSKEGENFEVTTLREDVNTDGRHAEVSFSKDWNKDSERRDFTINSIYLDQKGKIFDPQNGLIDLKEKKVKFIGNAQDRIKEDYLRIIRFLRFSIQYKSFNANDEVYKIIKKNLTGILQLSKERIFNEIKKIIELENLINIGSNKEIEEIFGVVFPEFKYLDRLKTINSNSYKKFIDTEKNLVLAILLIDYKDNHTYFAHKYKVSNFLKEYLNFLHTYFNEAKKNKNFLSKELKKNIFYHGKENIKSLAKFNFFMNTNKNHQNLDNILKKIDKINIPEFPINGKQLLEKGFKSGRKVGEVLKKIEKKWIENDFNLNDEELKNIINKNI